MKELVALLLAGLSVGLGNFAASIAIGLGGADKKTRVKLALVFGLFETGMPLLGLVLGHNLADRLGSHAGVIGGGLLILTGLYMSFEALKNIKDKEVKTAESGGLVKLLLTGLALSVDNLIVGFGLGTHHESLAEAAGVIGATSIILALLGLEIGNRASKKLEEFSEVASGLILIVVGLAIASGLLG